MKFHTQAAQCMTVCTVMLYCHAAGSVIYFQAAKPRRRQQKQIIFQVFGIFSEYRAGGTTSGTDPSLHTSGSFLLRVKRKKKKKTEQTYKAVNGLE